MSFVVTAALAGLFVVLPHDPGLSSLRVERTAGAVVVHAAFANADFAGAAPFDRDGDGAIGAAELAEAAPLLHSLAAAGFVLQAPDGAWVLADASAVIGENRDVELTLRFAGENAVDATLAVEFLGRLSRGHRCYAAIIGDGDTIVTDALLSPAARTFPVPAAVAATQPAGFGQAAAFFVLGVEHILIGFDHLAFLLALLAAGVTLRRAVLTITAFTVAHSVTLLAAALGVVRLPGLLVEATIAASIVIVAFANVMQRGARAPHRWPFALGFGLVHGFGFAGVLADLDVGGPDMFVPLLTFNLGVEVGQLAFALVVVPLLAVAARGRQRRAVTVVMSIAVGLAGLYWIHQRLFA